MGRHSKGKKGGKPTTPVAVNGVKSPSVNVNQLDGDEKSAFEVLKLNQKVQSPAVTPPSKSVRPLASEMRRKRHGNDGNDAKRNLIRTNAQILAERGLKVGAKAQANGVTASGQKVTKTVTPSPKKRKNKGTKRKAPASPVNPQSKHPRNEEEDEYDGENVFEAFIGPGKDKESPVVHKKIVRGGKIVEVDEPESESEDGEDVFVVEDDALEMAGDSEETEEKEEDEDSDEDEDYEEEEVPESEDEDDSTQQGSDSEAEGTGVFRAERKDFKPENHRVILRDVKGCRKTINFDELPFSKREDSLMNAKDAWKWIIAPMEIDEFFENVFEKKALYVARKNPQYYGNLYSTKKFVEILQQNYIEYGTHVNVAVYTDGERFTPNGIGKAYPDELRAQLAAGHSIQFINPQAYIDSVWHLCDAVEEMFGSFVGANTYLTPAGTAGFAPHWDEIDAFLLQLEGRKHWKVFAPIDDDDAMPRFPSGNFSDADMAGRTPVFDGWVEQGDLIYIPRGWIHQGFADKNTHSLHLTVSVCRRAAFVDMLEKFLPVAVTSLAEKTLSMRRSMPPGYMDMAGVLPSNYSMEKKAQAKVFDVLDQQLKALKNEMSDAYESAVDMMAREYLKSAAPPLLTKEELELSITHSKGFDLLGKKIPAFKMNTQIKFIRRHAQRLIYETEERCFVVHRMANSRIHEERPEVTFDLDVGLADGFASLVNAYPKWSTVSALDCPSDEERIRLARILYGNGLILAKF